jgi:hypothetical protein
MGREGTLSGGLWDALGGREPGDRMLVGLGSSGRLASQGTNEAPRKKWVRRRREPVCDTADTTPGSWQQGTGASRHPDG